MKAKLLLAAVIGLGIVSSGRADDATVKEVEKAIQALNEAFAKQDAAAIKKLVTDEHIAITPYYGGLATRDEQFKTLPDLKTTEYTVSQMKITLLTKDVALITYQLAQKGTFKGTELSPKNYASAVWVKRDGKWLEASYQETALTGK